MIHPWNAMQSLAMACAVFTLALPCIAQNASQTTAKFCVAQLREAPKIDGMAQAREWSAATLLPPLADQPNNLVQRQHSKIFLGWRDDQLFVAVRHQLATGTVINESAAEDAGQMQSGDHLTLAITSTTNNISGGMGLNFYLWPDRIFAMAADIPTQQGWQGKVTHDLTGWSAELCIPLAMLGADAAKDPTLQLQAQLHRGSQGQPPATLAVDLKLLAKSHAIRFLEGGQFPGDKLQGAMVEIVNDGSDIANCSSTFTLIGENGPIKTINEHGKMLAPDSSFRVQLAQPPKAGRYTVKYEVTTGERWPLASGDFIFEAAGPMQLIINSFHLWRGGVFARVNLAAADNATTAEKSSNDIVNITARLLDTSEKEVKSEATGQSQRPGSVELFLKTSHLPAGIYIVETKAMLNGKILGVVKQRITKPEIPAWWESR